MNFFESAWFQELWERVIPAASPAALSVQTLIIVLVVAAIAVGVPFVWLRFRLLVTLVHELGHAIIGMLVGRKFTGFVLRGDMSGAAVTVGPVRGFGRVITTWAGYPAPAVIGAAFAWLSGEGWAAPVISMVLLILLIALFRIRSLLTGLVMVIAIAAFAALWWWRVDAIQAPVLLGLGAVLVVGAWRHLGAVLLGGGSQSDPGVLAQLTGVPKLVWNLSFAVICGLATWVVAAEFAILIR
ncbi:M50 family metallopeptidase [Gulosibacter chungangensis]|uniref:M50 family metallopeptidase n=1 Tax=Gulosibacter chungangensis TaxID=979746 RepID=A0A7J5BE57_9MICO|nr:M50 family metallopeptidase [Gulosibacter chungangensis]KAB1644166.1 M50 family metallopeptidase [Gulosibacter chungangensis]